MRKALAVVICLVILTSLAIPVSAVTGISSGNIDAIVSSNGSCQITLDLTVHLEGSSADLLFPIPADARNITVNGNSASTSRGDGVRNIRLSSVLGNVTGDFTIRIQYTLPSVVAYDDSGKLMLKLPMLSGFNHPIENLTFSISLPGEIPMQPDFFSGYHQQAIESSMTFTTAGSLVRGTVVDRLKDRETLYMHMAVTEELFPQAAARQWSVGVVEILMAVAAGLAVVYWAVFLRCAPFLGHRSAAAPAGYTGGELAGMLCGSGNDLTMMVFSWAQLGYVLIHLQDSGRVTIHKRMDMGNERDSEEVRIFRNLFGKRSYIDGTGYHYANLCRRVAASTGGSRDMYKRSSGNPKVFRFLCAAIGALGGISLGYAIVGDALLGILLIAIMAVLGGISSWVMQDWAKGLFLRNKPALYLGLGLSAFWLIVGILSGVLNVAACMVGAQLLGGLAAYYGGRRTLLGRQILSETLGLRRYLKKLTPKEVQRICRSDPNYFFAMAPYALALGVLKPFAKRFGKRKLSACPYLTTGMDGHLTAPEWCQIMERAANSLDARQIRLPLERLTGK